jgi:hypothetical protein
MSIEDTLSERGRRYGDFKDHAAIAQRLKEQMKYTDGWKNLADNQRECLEMIAHKIARILNGDPNFIDSWHDISGYATLVEKQLQLDEARWLTPAAQIPGIDEDISL